MLIREDTRCLGLDAGSIASVVAVLGLGIGGVDGGSFFVHGVLLPALPVRDRGTRHSAHPRPLELPAYRQGSSSPARRDSCRGRPPVVARSRPRCGLLTSETPGRRTPALSVASTLWLPGRGPRGRNPGRLHRCAPRAGESADDRLDGDGRGGLPGGPPSTRTAGASGAPSGRRTWPQFSPPASGLRRRSRAGRLRGGHRRKRPSRRGDRGRSSSGVSAFAVDQRGCHGLPRQDAADGPVPARRLHYADATARREPDARGSGRGALAAARRDGRRPRDAVVCLRRFWPGSSFRWREPPAGTASSTSGASMFRAGFFHAIHPHRLTRSRWRGERYFANGLRGLAWLLLRRGPEPPRPRGGRCTGARWLTSRVVLQVSARLPVAGPTAVLPSCCVLCSSSSHPARGFQAFRGVAARDTGPARPFPPGTCNARLPLYAYRGSSAVRLPLLTGLGPVFLLCPWFLPPVLRRKTHPCPAVSSIQRTSSGTGTSGCGCFFRLSRGLGRSPVSFPSALKAGSSEKLFVREQQRVPLSVLACARSSSGPLCLFQKLFRPRREVVGNLGFFDAVEVVLFAVVGRASFAVSFSGCTAWS